MQPFRLRDYQVETIEAVYDSWKREVRRPAVVLPTGAGKTVVFSHIVHDVQNNRITDLQFNPGPAIVLAHRKELIDQAVNKLRITDRSLRIGVCKATRDEIRGRDVIVASTQTLARGRAARLRALNPSVVIVDEAHHYTSKTYLKVMEELGVYEEDGPRALGVSATLARNDKRHLAQLWEEVVYELPIQWMVDHGYLLIPSGRRVKIEGLSLDEVKKVHGDLHEGALGEAMSKAAAPEVIAKFYVEHASDRQGIVFATNVELSKQQALAFRELGVPAAHADGSMGEEERQTILDDFEAGRIQVISNCNLWTEGFDAPHASAIVIAKPTLSRNSYIQMVGRGLRPHPGQTECLVFDIDAGRTRHNLMSVTNLGLDRVTTDVDEEGKISESGPAVEAERKKREIREIHGRHVIEEFDFFNQTREKGAWGGPWRQTERGVWFIPLMGNGLIVLMRGQDFGTYSLAHMDADGNGRVMWANASLHHAFQRGKQIAHQFGIGIGARDAGADWRRRTVSAGQLALARSLNCADVSDDSTSGDVSDKIDVALGTRRLDHLNLAQVITSRDNYWHKEEIPHGDEDGSAS